MAGRGTSICHNHIAGWFDCICPESWKNPDRLILNRDCDVMFNELYDAEQYRPDVSHVLGKPMFLY